MVGQNVPKALLKLAYWYIGMMVISMLAMPNHLKKKDGKIAYRARLFSEFTQVSNMSLHREDDDQPPNVPSPEEKHEVM